jgi:hypothetical protein
MRLRLTVLLLGSLFIGAMSAAGQSLSVNGGGSATVRTASDFASDVMGDPWDFEQRTDFMYMMSDNNTTASGFQSLPDVSDGLLRGVINGQNGVLNVMMHWEGVTGAFNSVTKTGVKYPINANFYKRVSFRLKRDREINEAPESNRVGAQWFTAMRLAGGVIEQGAAGRYGSLPYANQSPVADQGKSTYHIYTLDLDQSNAGTAQWAGIMAGLSLKISTTGGMAGAPMELDWVRLTPRQQVGANLQWNGFGGRVTLTASNAATGDVVQIYPAAGTNDFPASGTFTWDYGFLPIGTWTITARAGGQTRNATLIIDAAPVLNITEPDATGGRDFATTTFGDAWDLTNQQDVFRHGQLYQIPIAAFTELGLDGVTNGDDNFVMLAGHNGMKIPAQTYHRLTYTIQFDNPQFMIWNVLNPDPGNPHNGGNVMRLAWNHSGGNVADYRVTQDIFAPDGFPQTYTVDLKTLDDTVTEVEPIGGQLWKDTNEMALFRIDLHEAPAQRSFRLSKVKLAADDEPNGNGFFIIKWNVADGTFSRQFASGNGSDATITFYYDTDLDASSKTLIASGINASAGQYAWDVSQLQPGVQYYVAAEITDSAGNSQLRYSTGPMRLRAAYPAGFRTDSNGNGLPDQWEANNSVSSGSADDDNDGVTNLQEYQAGTNPRISNVWNLSEGATGFFAQRLALANPDSAPADISIKYLRAGGKPPVTRDYTVLPYGRLTINVNEIAGFTTEDVSAVINSISGGVLAERTMFWGDQFYGGHTGKAIQEARQEWFLAEGAANSFFSTFILLANATTSPAHVNLMFLRENAEPFQLSATVEPNARYTIPTNTIDGLNGFSFATKITSDVPISVERSMYINSNPDPSHPFEGGTESAAVPEAKTEWYVAEGQASDFFSMFVLLANPNPSPTQVTLRYLMPGRAPTTKVLNLGPNSRYTVDIGNQNDAPGVANTDVSVEVKATLPIVVERAMYWPKNGARWTDGHNSAGVTSTGSIWALAEGEFGGSRQFQSYVLMANPSNTDADVEMTLLREGEGRAPLSLRFTVPANQRLTKSAADFVPLGLQSGERFGVIVKSHNGAPIVVERAMYWNGGGEFWGAGTNETGFKLK